MVTGLYFRVISAVLLVIMAMLLLQNGLNQLKFRSLVADATASRLQVVASSIEGAIARAEGAGLAIDEMTGLSDLIARETARDEVISDIAVISPIGRVLVSTSAQALPEADREAVLRRVLGSGDRLSSIVVGERLYVARVLYDSANAAMGAVLLATPTALYLDEANATSHRLNLFYLGIFAVVTLVLVPVVIVLFAPVRRLYAVLRPEAVQGAALAPADADAASYAALIAQGNAALADAEAELARITSSHAGERSA